MLGLLRTCRGRSLRISWRPRPTSPASTRHRYRGSDGRLLQEKTCRSVEAQFSRLKDYIIWLNVHNWIIISKNYIWTKHSLLTWTVSCFCFNFMTVLACWALQKSKVYFAWSGLVDWLSPLVTRSWIYMWLIDRLYLNINGTGVIFKRERFSIIVELCSVHIYTYHAG